VTEGVRPKRLHLTRTELDEHHAQLHVRKAMSMFYEYEPFQTAKVISQGRRATPRPSRPRRSDQDG
jgi:hypothetical protein